MLLTLLIIGGLFGGAAFLIKQRYALVCSKVEQVQYARKQVNQVLNARHKVIRVALQFAQDNGLKVKTFKMLATLRNKVKSAHESKDDHMMVQAEVLISELEPKLIEILQACEQTEELVQSLQSCHKKMKKAVQVYHQAVEAYEDVIEQFIESVLIAVFEKDLYHKFPIFESEEEDSLEDNFVV